MSSPENVDTKFSNSGTTITPIFSSASSPSVNLDATTPAWALAFQTEIRKLTQKLASQEIRLASVENLAVENAKLRAELSAVKAASTEAKTLLQTQVSLPATTTTPKTSSSPSLAVVAQKATPSSSVVSASAARPTFASVVASSSGSNTTTTATTTATATRVKRKRKSKKPVPPSPATLAALSRKFSPKSDSSSPNGYRFIYYKASKHPLSWYREKILPLIGVSNSRVIDIHFPTHRVVCFLVHADFVLEFTSTLHKNLKIDPLLDFDPLEDANLHDPALASSDPATRLRKLQDLQNIRVLCAIIFVRLSVRVSVARSILSQDFISQPQFDAILADTLAARAAQAPATTVFVSAQERKEKKRSRVDYYFNLNYLDPVSALTLASSPPSSGPSTGTNAKASAAALNAIEV